MRMRGLVSFAAAERAREQRERRRQSAEEAAIVWIPAGRQQQLDGCNRRVALDLEPRVGRVHQRRPAVGPGVPCRRVPIEPEQPPQCVDVRARCSRRGGCRRQLRMVGQKRAGLDAPHRGVVVVVQAGESHEPVGDRFIVGRRWWRPRAGRDGLDVADESRPTGEAVLPRDRTLSAAEGERRIGAAEPGHLESLGRASPDRALQIPGALAQLREVGSFGKGLGERSGRHCDLLSCPRGPRGRAKGGDMADSAVTPELDRWAQPFPRTRRRPTRLPERVAPRRAARQRCRRTADSRPCRGVVRPHERVAFRKADAGHRRGLTDLLRLATVA